MAFNINIKNVNYSCAPMVNNNNTIAYLCDSRKNVETFQTAPPSNFNSADTASAAGLAILTRTNTTPPNKVISKCTTGAGTTWNRGTCKYGNSQYKATCPVGYTLSSTDGYCNRNNP